MGTPNKRQHWVPQFYLRYFATEATRDSSNPQVWATSVQDGPVIRPHIKNVATESFLYSPLLEDGTRDDSTDARLRDIETLMGGLWPQIAEDHYPLDDGFRKGMSLFLSTMLLRHPKARGMQQQVHAMFVRLLDEAPKDEAGIPLVDRVLINGKEQRLDTCDWLRFRDRTDNETHREFADFILSSGGPIARVLLERTPWNVVFADEPVFATSDHPVATDSETQKRPGVGRPDTVIYFPISPRRMLVIGQPGWRDGEIYPLRRGAEGFFNFFIYRAAQRFLFTPCEPTPLFQNLLQFTEALTGQAPMGSLLSGLGEPATGKSAG